METLATATLADKMIMIGGQVIAIGLTTRKENVARHRLSDSDR